LPEEYVPHRREIFGISTDIVEVDMDGMVSLQMTSERFANLRCSAFELQNPVSGCRPKFTAPRIENQVVLRMAGVIGKRLRVDVDLDTRRDYTNANTIRAYYQGLQDEVLQRVDVGTVQFRPPPSQFLTAGIPTNNFGVSATVEYGPLTIQALAATQSGSVVADRTYRVGETTVEPQDRLVRDLDFETGRFFWVTDPRTLASFPRIDPLALANTELPPSVRPADVRIYRYRAATATGANPNLGGIRALARNTFGAAVQQVGPLQWELLVRGKDYYLDPSGLWFVLSAKLDPDDFLAVS
jgi:cell surface protein SprA